MALEDAYRAGLQSGGGFSGGVSSALAEELLRKKKAEEAAALAQQQGQADLVSMLQKETLKGEIDRRNKLAEGQQTLDFLTKMMGGGQAQGTPQAGQGGTSGGAGGGVSGLLQGGGPGGSRLGSFSMDVGPVNAKFDVPQSEEDFNKELNREVKKQKTLKEAKGASSPDATLLAATDSTIRSVDGIMEQILDENGQPDPEAMHDLNQALKTQFTGLNIPGGKFIRMFQQKQLTPRQQSMLKKLDLGLINFVQSRGGKQLTRTEIQFITTTFPSMLDADSVNIEALQMIKDISENVKRRMEGARALGFEPIENPNAVADFTNGSQFLTADEMDQILQERGLSQGNSPQSTSGNSMSVDDELAQIDARLAELGG